MKRRPITTSISSKLNIPTGSRREGCQKSRAIIVLLFRATTMSTVRNCECDHCVFVLKSGKQDFEQTSWPPTFEISNSSTKSTLQSKDGRPQAFAQNLLEQTWKNCLGLIHERSKKHRNWWRSSFFLLLSNMRNSFDGCWRKYWMIWLD